MLIVGLPAAADRAASSWAGSGATPAARPRRRPQAAAAAAAYAALGALERIRDVSSAPSQTRTPGCDAVPLREGANVKPLELFFDLVFVLAFTQCTALMADEPTWEGLAKGAAHPRGAVVGVGSATRG